MIRAQHSLFFTWFFRIYSLQMIRFHFRKVTIKNDFEDKGHPVLLIGNHFSWWDGFIANMLNIKVFRRIFHIMMLEDQLRSRMFLNKAGAYSIKKGNRSALESLKYTSDLLGNSNNLVTIYPQGEFESVSQSPVSFQKGLNEVTSRLHVRIHLVFYVALVDYFSFRKPALTIYIRECQKADGTFAASLESDYNLFLKECIKQQKPD
jgi:hypothetical protein